MKKGTQTTLVKELETIEPKTDGLKKLTQRAIDGNYHDFKSEFPMPKIMLFRDLDLLGYNHIAERVFDGEFDEL